MAGPADPGQPTTTYLPGAVQCFRLKDVDVEGAVCVFLVSRPLKKVHG
jgi:hypothetical protein